MDWLDYEPPTMAALSTCAATLCWRVAVYSVLFDSVSNNAVVTDRGKQDYCLFSVIKARSQTPDSQHTDNLVINPVVHCHYIPPGLWLPSRSKNITTNYTENPFSSFYVKLLTDRQMDKRTNAGHYITSLAEVISSPVQFQVFDSTNHY